MGEREGSLGFHDASFWAVLMGISELGARLDLECTGGTSRRSNIPQLECGPRHQGRVDEFDILRDDYYS